jgi:hypothetical protein
MRSVQTHGKVRNMGYKGRRGRYPGNGPFRDLSPWQRPGWVYGYGRGYGLSYGRGYGYAGDSTKCARFPWLPRWWWSNPDYQGAVPAPPADLSAAALVPDERVFLQNQTKYLEQELAAIRKRLEELGFEETD